MYFDIVLIFKISECFRKIAASLEGADKAMASQHESYTSPRRLPGYSVHLNPYTTSEPTEVTTGKTITVNNVPMQLIEHKSLGESIGTNLGNCSRCIHPVTGIADDIALFEETQETVQGTVGKYLRNKSWKPECVGSFNMDWWILVLHPEAEARDTIY